MFRYALRAAIFSLGLAQMLAAQPQSTKASRPAPCTDIAATFEIFNGFDENVNTVLSRIRGDGGGLYVAGVSKVSSNLFVCGSGDATLNLLTASRTLIYDFGDDLYTNSNTPAWITSSPAPTFSVTAFLNFKELAKGYVAARTGGVDQNGDPYNISTTNYLETKLYSYFYYGKGYSNQYFLRANGNSADPEINTPNWTSPVQAIHHAADPGGNNDWWEVYPMLSPVVTTNPVSESHVATLSRNGINLGQFNMPFYIIIRRK